jgi:hypothetical protein
MLPALPPRPPVALHSVFSLARHQARRMLVNQLRDLLVGQPDRRPENPKPSRESTTTLKASEDAVPCANGSVSSGSS